MSLRLRLLIVLLAIYCAGGYFITRWTLDQVRPRYLENRMKALAREVRADPRKLHWVMMRMTPMATTVKGMRM